MRNKPIKPQLTYYDIAEGVTAFSSTRHGGYSQGNHGEFNVNMYCSDDPEDIAENRKALCRMLKIPVDRLIMPHQVHQTGIVQIGKTFLRLSDEVRRDVLKDIDALMTNLPGVCIGVSTADCIPIILYDPEHHAAGVIHSGWRGTVANIAGVAVTSMQMAYHSRPEALKAVIGPGISLEHFEVGDEVYEQFAAAGYPMAQIARRYEKWHIDLPGCNRRQLLRAGLPDANITDCAICTYRHYDEFFSARRLGIRSGRIFTAIMLQP